LLDLMTIKQWINIFKWINNAKIWMLFNKPA
jgi:hypothetical protein